MSLKSKVVFPFLMAMSQAFCLFFFFFTMSESNHRGVDLDGLLAFDVPSTVFP